MSAFKLGLGIWEGKYEGVTRFWLRWSDSTGNWILTLVEEEQQHARQAVKQLQHVVFNLAHNGMTVEQIA